MSEIICPMGSPTWVAQVFSTPPVRKLKGHWRRTQYHGYDAQRNQSIVGVQGRNELCAALALEYLKRLGYINRFKPQPFEADQEEFGNAITPDFMAQGKGAADDLFVIEVKSARFLTRIKHLELDDYRVRFSERGMRYLLWTDERPLSRWVRHNLINMRAATQRYVTQTEVEHLVQHVREARGATRVSNLVAAGFDLDCLFAAAWEGKVFFPIVDQLTFDTRVTVNNELQLDAMFLGRINTVEAWWSSLKTC